MEATTTNTGFGIMMLEWFDNRTGKELLDEVLPLLSGDGIHIFQPEVLDYSPYEGGVFQGEMELWFSFYAPSLGLWREVIDSIRDKGIRVKEGHYSVPEDIAKGEARAMWDWIYDSSRWED